jgi:hypothetical protein
MGFLDLLGITKRVNETDIIRKKEEIDALYAEMLTITDNLTKTAQKIKDLKDQINNLPPAENKKEADKNTENKTEIANSSATEEPVKNNIKEVNDDGIEENENSALFEGASPVTQPAADKLPAVQATQSMEQPLFGTGTLQTAPLVNPNNATNNNIIPPPPGNFTGQHPSQFSQYQMQQPPLQLTGQPMSYNNREYDLQSSDGGKKNRKTKSANSLKRKRRTRRNKKVVAAEASAATEASTEAST